MGWEALSFVAKGIAGKYLEGLLNTDAIKKVGANHRQQVVALGKKSTDALRGMCNRLAVMVQNGLDGIGMNRDLAVTLHFQIDDSLAMSSLIKKALTIEHLTSFHKRLIKSYS